MSSYLFELTQGPFTLNTPSPADGAGALVRFDGIVRPDAINGNTVTGIFYEAHPTLAGKTGQRLLELVGSQFGLVSAKCIHRIGFVKAGDPSITVECRALHRHDAFAACEEIMDRIKQEVPIWKEERFENGDSVWKDGVTGPERNAYFHRQLKVSEIGELGLNRLQSARVALVGAGGLGCIIARLLAGNGVGNLTLIDEDTVSESDLHRQILYDRRDIGRPKVAALKNHLSLSSPFCNIELLPEKLTSANAPRLLRDADFVIDAVDTFSGKLAINDFCWPNGIPFLHGALSAWQGQMLLIQKEWPCLRCLWQGEPFDGCVGTCREEGVSGPVPNIVGSLMANEAIKYIAGIESALAPGKLALVDGFQMGLRTLNVGCWKDCPVCHPTPDATLPDKEKPLSLPLDTINDLEDFRIISMESDPPPAPFSGKGLVVETCLSPLTAKLEPGEKPLLILCHHGFKSQVIAKILREKGIMAYSLQGGTDSLAAKK